MKKMLTRAKKALGQTAAVTAKSMKSARGAVAVHGRKAVVVGLGAGKTLGGWMFKAVTVENEGAKEDEAAVPEAMKEKAAGMKPADRMAALKLGAYALPGRLTARFRALPSKSKRLFCVASALVLLLLISVITIGVRRGQENALANYEKAVSEIRQQIDSAEASMIYRDEARARRLLEEAAAAVAVLPDKNQEQASMKLQLTQDMDARFAGLRHAVTLDAPEVLSTVVTQTGSPDLRTLAAVGANLWAAASDGTVFKISTEDGTATAVHTLTSGGAPEIFTALSSGVLMGGRNGLVSVSSGGQVTVQALNAGDFELGFNDAAVFGSRLYLLDAAHNRILKFASVSGGFGSPQVYVKDGTDLSGAVSLTIDGKVYVLSTNGSIAKLMSGKSESYTADQVDPPLVSPILVRTPDANADLYVLDTGRPRVARFDKESGHLVAQYESDGLQGVTSIQVNQTDRTILATKGNQVLRFTWKEEE
jgi:hypothetical protein